MSRQQPLIASTLIRSLGFTMACVFASRAPMVYAQQQLTKTLSAQQFYSDNIDLLPRSGKNAEHITDFRPSLLYQRDNKQHRLEAFYELQAVHFGNNARDDELMQRGFLRFEAPNHVKHYDINVFVRSTQEVISPENNVIKDIFSDETTDVLSFLIQPSFYHQLGDMYRVRYQLSHGQVHYLNDDKKSNRDYFAQINFIPNPRQSRVQIAADAQKRWTYIGNDLDVHDEHTHLFIVGPITAKTQFIVNLGYDNYHQDQSTNQVEGLSLMAGFDWALSRFTKTKVLLGRRPFGNSIEFNASTQTKYHVFSAKYEEFVENSARSNLRQLPQVNAQNLLYQGTDFTPSVTNGLFVSKNHELQWQAILNSVVTQAAFFYNRQQLVDSYQVERDYGVNMDVSKDFDPYVFRIKGGYAQHRFSDFERDRRTLMELEATRRFAQHVQVIVFASKYRYKNSFLFTNTQQNSGGIRLIYES